MADEVKEIKRSRYVGLKDFYLAEVLENTETSYRAGTPYKLARAISAKVTDNRSAEELESDDTTEESLDAYSGTDVELEINSLAPQDMAFMFGHKYENGYLIKNENDKAPEVALGYRERKLNGKYEFVWLYVGRFSKGHEESRKTYGKSPTAQTETVKGSFRARRLDGAYDLRVDEDNLLSTNTSAAAAIQNWFSAVQEAGSAG